LLRRLACPHLPPNPRVLPNGLIGWDTSLPHNPYITVDYLEHVRLNEAQANQRVSEGRMQPYAAALRSPQRPLFSNQQHTFFRHNQPRQLAFDWLVHLDRPLVSPMDLLHVSGCKRHELTQRFMIGNRHFQHRPPWFDSAARIYRVFEFLAARPRAAGFEPHRFTARVDVRPGRAEVLPLSPDLLSPV